MLRGKTGGGWIVARQLVDLPEAVWAECVRVSLMSTFILICLIFYLQEKKGLARWRHTPFPLYDDIADLIVGKHATGEGAISITNLAALAPVQPDNSSASSSDSPAALEVEEEDPEVQNLTYLSFSVY